MNDAARRQLTEPRVELLRRERAHAFSSQHADLAITASLELARLLVDNHLVPNAAHELELTLDQLSQGQGLDVVDSPAELWRLLLTLAVLYKGLADEPRARLTASAAWRCASHHHCELGRERARAFLRQLPCR